MAGLGQGLSTFAPAATALRTSIWHCARLWVMDAVEHICPTACGRIGISYPKPYLRKVPGFIYRENHSDVLRIGTSTSQATACLVDKGCLGEFQQVSSSAKLPLLVNWLVGANLKDRQWRGTPYTHQWTSNASVSEELLRLTSHDSKNVLATKR